MAKTKATKATANKGKKMTFEKRVKAVIAKSAETKMKVVNIFDRSPIIGSGAFTTGGTTTGRTQNNILDVIDLGQGTEQEQRVGNKISNAKLKVRGYVESLVWDDTSNNSLLPFEIHMVFFKNKTMIKNPNTDLKTLPNNTTSYVDGTIMNSLYPYNKDLYIIRKVRVFRMRSLFGEPPAPVNQYNIQTANFPMFHRFVEDIDIHKELKFNDGETVPTNDWVGVSFFLINGDGKVLDGTQIRAKVSLDAILRYDDE